MQTSALRVIRAACFLLLLGLLAAWPGAGWRTVQAATAGPAFRAEQTAQGPADGSYEAANYDPEAKPNLRLAGWKIHRCCFGSRATRPARAHGGRKHNRPYDRRARLSRTHFRYRKPRHTRGFRLNHPKNRSNVPARHPRRTASPRHARS